MAFHRVLQSDRLLFATADAFEGALSQIHILEILQVLKDGFSNVESLGMPSTPGEITEALFDGLRKPNGQHGCLAIRVWQSQFLLTFFVFPITRLPLSQPLNGSRQPSLTGFVG